MGNNSANPAAFGYIVVFITGWLFSMVSAGWFGQTVPELGNVMAVYGGGVAAFVVGILLYLRGDHLDMFTLMGLGLFFFVVGMVNLSGDPVSAPESSYGAWYDIIWALYFLGLWFTGRGEDATRGWFLLVLGLTLVIYGLAYWISPVMIMIGGYLGLIASLLAFYVAYNELSASLNSEGT